MDSEYQDINHSANFGSHSTPYEVPEDFFVHFPQRILNRAKARSREAVPEGYFESLPQMLLSKIRTANPVLAELDEIAPGLKHLPRSMPYQAPAGYFEQPVAAAPSQKHGGGGKLFSLRRMAGWAVAAAVTGIIGFALWPSFFSGASDSTTEIASTLASLPDDAFDGLADGKETAGTTSFEVGLGWKTADKALDNFSEEELQHYLQQSGLDALYDN